jgi:TRAP-type C4-dicarboxylate transport system permease small subunit
MNLYDKIMQGIIGFGMVIGSFALAAVMLIIMSNVIYRAFGGIIAGTYDLVEITVIIVAAFSIAGTELHNRHTTVDMITRLFKEKVQLWLENGCNLVSFVYWSVIALSSAKIALEKAEIGEVTEFIHISIIPFRILWVYGLVLICLVIIYNIYRNLLRLKGK